MCKIYNNAILLLKYLFLKRKLHIFINLIKIIELIIIQYICISTRKLNYYYYYILI